MRFSGEGAEKRAAAAARAAAAFPVPGAPPSAFAVVSLGAHQFKVSPGDQITTEKLPGALPRDVVRLPEVLLVGTRSETLVGRPAVAGAEVLAEVEEQVLGEKVLSFKKRRRKNSRRLRGHRQELTLLRVLEISGLEGALEAAEEVS